MFRPQDVVFGAAGMILRELGLHRCILWQMCRQVGHFGVGLGYGGQSCSLLTSVTAPLFKPIWPCILATKRAVQMTYWSLTTFICSLVMSFGTSIQRPFFVSP